jgi:hypothetical protein
MTLNIPPPVILLINSIRIRRDGGEGACNMPERDEKLVLHFKPKT